MTCFEINKRLAELLGEFEDPKDSQTEVIGDKLCFRNDTGYIVDCHKDYCNDWGAMGPIIHDLRVVITYYEFEDGGFCTIDSSFYIDFEDGGELRSAALTAIKVLEDGK